MANDLSKNIDIFFKEVVEGFDAQNLYAKNCAKYKPEVGALSVGGNTFYRPQRALTTLTDGRDVSSAYKDLIDRTIPSTLTDAHLRNSPLQLTGQDLNNPYVMENMVRASDIALSNKLDTLVADEVALKGTQVVINTGNIDKYEEVALADAIMLEQQVTQGQRCVFLNPRMSVNLAGNIAGRATMNKPVMDAYTRNMLPPIAGFDTFRTDYSKTLVASTAANYTVDGGDQGYTPIAKHASTGLPIDNRTQDLTIQTGTGGAVGDAFTIAGVFSVGHINKQSTGQLKTFRIIAVNSATSWEIAPAMIPADGSDQAQKAYATVNTVAADEAVIVALNIVTKPVSVFFEKPCVEIIHADYNTEAFSASGKKVRKSTTDSGIQIVMLSDSNIDTLVAKYRMFIWANVELLEYEAAGILLEGQT